MCPNKGILSARCPRCGHDFDAENEKDNECPNCSLSFDWYILPFEEPDGKEAYVDMIRWI